MRIGDILLHPVSDGTFLARLRPIDRDTTIAPGITALAAPGDPPGHPGTARRRIG